MDYGKKLMLKVGDLVRHKRRKLVGTVYEIKRDRVLVDWSDQTGVMFRWARKQDLEVISESR